MKRLMVVAALVIALAIPAAADHYGDFYVIPVAGHLPGANGTFFQTDLVVQNFNDSTTLMLNIVVLDAETGELTPLTQTPVTVPAKGSAILEDLLDGFMDKESVRGALLVGGNHPFAISSRTYNTGDAGGTYGQTIPGVRDFIENSSGMTPDMATAYLPGIINNDDFRTNIGFLVGANNVVAEDLVVQVRLFDRNGAQYGSAEYTFPAGEFAQRQVNITSIDPRVVNIASANVTVTQGNGTIIPYLSVVDNVSGDGNFILGNFPGSSPFAKTGLMSSFEEAFYRVMSGR